MRIIPSSAPSRPSSAPRRTHQEFDLRRHARQWRSCAGGRLRGIGFYAFFICVALSFSHAFASSSAVRSPYALSAPGGRQITGVAGGSCTFGATIFERVLSAPDAHTIRDLDGDLRPDLIRYRSGGADRQGYLYTIEFEMSGGRVSPPIDIHAKDPLGLEITARDVDGDHDLDLVVTGLEHGQHIDVWLNDGRGGFTPAGILRIPSSVWSPDLSLQPSEPSPARDTSAIVSGTSVAVLLPGSMGLPANSRTMLRRGADSAAADPLLSGNSRPRAPPAS